jgi:dTDP-4-dehydrorhamnose reductase
MKNSPKNIVVGAKGYIGSALVTASKKYKVTIGTSSSNDNDLIQLRLDSPDDFDYRNIKPNDTVLLTAAVSAPDICSLEYEKARAVNVLGSSRFIENVVRCGARVIFFSSDAIYGECESEFDELAVCNPVGEYAEMKCEVEQRFAGNSSFKAIRLSYVFSREDKFTKYLKKCVENNIEADIFHPFFRAIVYRDDVVNGALALVEKWDETPEQFINFGGPQILSRVDFTKCLSRAYLDCIRYKVTDPNDDFFKNRPRVIAMTSPIFPKLLGRKPHTLCEAVNLEFPSF